MKKLYLHTGTNKTGSSYVQRFFYKNKQQISSQGIDVISFKEIPEIKNFRSVAVSRNKAIINTYHTFFRGRLKNESDYFLSWEGFTGTPEKLFSDLEKTQVLLKEVIPSDIQLEIITVFRRQDDFIQSMYTQFIHKGMFETAKDFLFRGLSYNKGLDWLEHINTMNDVFPNASKYFIPYDKQVLEKITLPELFLKRMGIKVEETHIKNGVEAINVGFNADANKIYEEIVPNLKSISAQNFLRKILQKNSNKGVFEEYSNYTFEEKNMINDLYKSSNLLVAKKYWKSDFSLNGFSNPQNVSLNNTKKDFTMVDLVVLLLEEKLSEKKTMNNTQKLKKFFKNRLKKMDS